MGKRKEEAAPPPPPPKAKKTTTRRSSSTVEPKRRKTNEPSNLEDSYEDVVSFKDPSKSKLAEAQAAGRRPAFKNLKQILKTELGQPYQTITAPPPLNPTKKYCDLTGFVVCVPPSLTLGHSH